jgi:hypothetical protein
LEITLPVAGISGPIPDTDMWVAVHADLHLLDSYANESNDQTQTQSSNITLNQNTLLDLDSMKPSQEKFFVPSYDTEIKSMMYKL